MTATNKKLSNAELDRQLESALENTFPASDAVTIGDVTALTPDRPADRQAPKIDRALVDRLAKEVASKKGVA